MATGMLPICFGEATKFSQYMLDADKVYLATARLGVTTASGDADSEVLEVRKVEQLSEAEVEQVLERFRGEIEQVPSMYSALKHNGQPLYKLARQGVEVERASRLVTISSLRLLALRDDEIDLEVHCSKGTYVRTLVEDIGEVLGCGAHVTALRRTGVGSLDHSAVHPLAVLERMAEDIGQSDERYRQMDKLLLPIETAVENLPEIVLSKLMVYYVRQGQPVFVPNTQVQGKVMLLNKEADEEERFLGVGEILDDGRVAPRRLVNTG